MGVLDQVMEQRPASRGSGTGEWAGEERCRSDELHIEKGGGPGGALVGWAVGHDGRCGLQQELLPCPTGGQALFWVSSLPPPNRFPCRVVLHWDETE